MTWTVVLLHRSGSKWFLDGESYADFAGVAALVAAWPDRERLTAPIWVRTTRGEREVWLGDYVEMGVHLDGAR